MNKVILMGRLTRDPDIRYSQGANSMAVARFTLAVDRRFSRNSDQSADFISCVAFGRLAEFFEKYVKQGTKLVVEGRIQTGSYVNRDGQKVYTTDVVLDNAEFAESKAADTSRRSASGQAPAQNYNQAPAQNYSQAPAQAARPSYPAPENGADDSSAREAAGEGFMDITDGLEDEGLPFN